jgi:hypothetical protein
MDIAELEKFINYKPVFDEDPYFLVEDIKNKAKQYLLEQDLAKIDEAYQFAKQAHA